MNVPPFEPQGDEVPERAASDSPEPRVGSDDEAPRVTQAILPEGEVDRANDDGDMDTVEQASLESFPASDAPSWSPRET